MSDADEPALATTSDRTSSTPRDVRRVAGYSFATQFKNLLRNLGKDVATIDQIKAMNYNPRALREHLAKAVGNELIALTEEGTYKVGPEYES